MTEVSGFATEGGSMTRSYSDNYQASVQDRGRASYDGVRSFGPGQTVIAFGESVIDVKFFYTNASHAKAMRVTRYIGLPPPDETVQKHSKNITALRDLMVKKGWTALKADVSLQTSTEIQAMVDAIRIAKDTQADPIDRGVFGLANIYALSHPIDLNAPDVVETAPLSVSTSTDAPAPSSGNPMGFFSKPNGFAGGGDDAITEEVAQGPISYHDLLKRPEPEVNLDEESKNVLEEAARKARESIFRSDDKKEE